jgi:hypothetical protein
VGSEYRKNENNLALWNKGHRFSQMNTDKSKVNFSAIGGLFFSAIAADYHIYPCPIWEKIKSYEK